MKQKITIITGPTAVGKTEIAIKLAKAYNAEIISADSMQIYKNLDIGTGKIMPCEMDGVRHHLIDIINPDEQYSVGSFVNDCKNIIQDIALRGKNIFIVGGTGLYINALINGHNFANAPKDNAIRQKYIKLAEDNGCNYIYELLKRCDKVSSEKISPNDTKRIIRALEIYEITGRAKSEIAQTNLESEFDYKLFVINDERENLYKRINARVEKMFKAGLLQEVNELMQYRYCQSMQAIGYKEIIECIDNKINPSCSIEQIKQNSRRYAKRQITYFKGLKAEKIWVNIQDLNEIIAILNAFYSTMCDIVL